MKNEEKWQRMSDLWEEIQSSPSNADLSLWDRVLLLAEMVDMSPWGVRKFLKRTNKYELIVTL